MTTVYEHHDKAFANVSAYVIARKGERVATIALKFPKDGAGRLWAYVHWIGTPMVRGYADGYGYDKRSAAVEAAASKIERVNKSAEAQAAREAAKPLAAQAAEMSAIADNERLQPFLDALCADSGEYFDTRLRAAGFDVWQAV